MLISSSDMGIVCVRKRRNLKSLPVFFCKGRWHSEARWAMLHPVTFFKTASGMFEACQSLA